MRKVPLLAILSLFIASCFPAESDQPQPLFTLLAPEVTGVTFRNEIVEREGLNVLEYEYFYNGGGVAVGDLNNNGLPDIFFTANMGPNRLYLNRGDFRFEDITEQAGVAGGIGWTTGVVMADVTGNGYLDIYVLKSGPLSEDLRRNELYVNNGDLTFTERAAEFGLDDPSYSTHAAFFDYDGDGHLDLFLCNANVERFTRFDVEYIRNQRDPWAGDKLYRNDGDRFVDVSAEAGIIGNPIGFCLSAMVADINRDGCPDIYVANDYIEDDYLYINNCDGTFREELKSWIDHTSFFSMGADIADINNNGLLDIVVLDMLPEDNKRQKLLRGPDDFDRYEMMIRNQFHHKYMRNVLQLNNGNGTFSEIGQVAGISNTDWSWAALLADFDNDGYKDLYVTNGYMRDYTNMDFLKFTVQEANREAQSRSERVNLFDLVKKMPSTDLANYIFRNRGDLTFENVTQPWGLNQFALSGGAAYADLNGNGALDLVVNNINQGAFIYRNNAPELGENAYLRVRLEGEGLNTFGLGAKVTLHASDGRLFYQEMMPTRGYQSSVEPVLHFGLGDLDAVAVEVTWPDGRYQQRADVKANQTITLYQSDAGAAPAGTEETHPMSRFSFIADGLGLDFVHIEDDFIDFKREPLLPHMLSRFGPALATADVNGDGLEDVYVGGAAGQPGTLYLQQADGRFTRARVAVFDEHAGFEDVDALFADLNGNGRADLYVVSGGNHEDGDFSAYRDRVYWNDGFGNFRYDPEALPEIAASGGVVAAHDFTGDGLVDLFVGGRVLPGRYPLSPRSYLLRNAGGRFDDVTVTLAPALLEPGMVTDALWADLTGDGTAELIITGEWMPIRVFAANPEGRFTELTAQLGLDKTNGWWNALAVADLDGDGRLDIVAGNRGLNAQMQASIDQPAAIFAADFDNSGQIDPIVSYYIQGSSYPMPARDELLDQIPMLRQRFTSYASYANATMEDLFSRDQLTAAVRLEAHELASSIFWNRVGHFEKQTLPIEAQFSTVNAILVADFEDDEGPDLLLAGNNFAVRAQSGRFDAGQGLLLRNHGDGGFEPVRAAESGFMAPGQVQAMRFVDTPAGTVLVVANNSDRLSTFRIHSP